MEKAQAGNDDFAFLEGRWTITHRKLIGRLVGSEKWQQFRTDYEFRTLLGGLANIDRLWGILDGQAFEGISIRTYNPQTGEWTIFWMDSGHPRLTEQVRGTFRGRRGAFFGETRHGGEKVRVRFTWENLGNGRARWEQAYQDPNSRAWETNWIMDFRRLAPPSP